MILSTEDGFEVSLETNEFSFVTDSILVKVSKVINYEVTEAVPVELAEDHEFLVRLIEQLKERVEETINAYK